MNSNIRDCLIIAGCVLVGCLGDPSGSALAGPNDHYKQQTIWERITSSTGERLRRDYRNTSRRAILGNASRLMDRLEPNGRSVGRRNEILRELVMGNAYRAVDDVDRIIR